MKAKITSRPSRFASLLRHAITGSALAAATFIAVHAVNPAYLGIGSAPSPDLTPREVVKIQLNALRRNTADDAGIAVAYRFASSANQQSTGPFSQFAAMLRSGDYGKLLNHLSTEFGPTLADGGSSYVPVVVTDRRGVSHAYVWVLSRSQSNTCDACWMTDAVILAGRLNRLRFA